METAKIKKSAIARAEIQRRRRAQRMETAKIKTSVIAQAEIQRRRRAQRMETAKIKTSTTARQRSLCNMQDNLVQTQKHMQRRVSESFS